MTVINRTDDANPASMLVIPKELNLDIISRAAHATNLEMLVMPRLDKWHKLGVRAVAKLLQLLSKNLLCL